MVEMRKRACARQCHHTLDTACGAVTANVVQDVETEMETTEPQDDDDDDDEEEMPRTRKLQPRRAGGTKASSAQESSGSDQHEVCALQRSNTAGTGGLKRSRGDAIGRPRLSDD